jgi:ParB-like chromosome segregation protein Spo0J
MRMMRWSLDEIVIAARMRDRLRDDAIASLMESIQKIGLREPPTIRIGHDEDEDGGEYPILVAGLHRIEALKRLGAQYADCAVFDGDETEARLWEISENMHRAELSELEWSEHVAEWKRLTEVQSEQNVQNESERAEVQSEQHVQNESKLADRRGHRHEGGIAKAARELPIPGATEDAKRMRVVRAIKIADIAPEAKEAAKAAGLANNQKALLTVAQAEPEQQARVVEEIAERKAQKAKDTDTVDRKISEKKAANAALTEAQLFAEWLTERMARNEMPKIISWLEGCKSKDVTAAMRQKAA